MGEDWVWDKDWWRERKASSLERKRRAEAESAIDRRGDSFLIVTEGTVTEPIYFSLLICELQLSTVKIKVMPGVHSDPRHVIRTAYAESQLQMRRAKTDSLAIDEPAKFDHVWAVIDTDVAVRQNFWNEVQQLAKARRISLAHSTPCFEYWLLMHIVEFTTRTDLVDGDAAKSAVKHALGHGYSTKEETAKAALAAILPNWPKAVAFAERVRRHHLDAQTTPPANPSTEVDLLVRALSASGRAHQQQTRSGG
jgi:alcohol dehydrogenase class IV